MLGVCVKLWVSEAEMPDVQRQSRVASTLCLTSFHRGAGRYDSYNTLFFQILFLFTGLVNRGTPQRPLKPSVHVHSSKVTDTCLGYGNS